MKPKHLSPSQIGTLEKCGMQYRYRYLEGLKSPPGIALLRGTATHVAIEANMKSKMDTGSPLPQAAIREAAAAAFDIASSAGEFVVDGPYEDMSVPEALAAGKDGAVQLSALHSEALAPLIEPTGIEMRVTLPASESLAVDLVGVVDLVDRDTIVRDTKTSAKTPSASLADTSMQLSAYALLFAALKGGRLPESLTLDYLISTKTGKRSHTVLETTRGWEDIQAVVLRANAALAVIQAELFMPAPADSWVCTARFCGYFDRCPYGARGRSTRARMPVEVES